MSLFRKFFGSSNPASDEDKESEFSKSFTDNATSIDEKFIYNFKKMVVNFYIVRTQKK